MSVVFVVTACVSNELHKNQLTRCIDSIRKYHNNNMIYLINDSNIQHDDYIHALISTYENIKLVPSYNKGCGEQQIFKFILDCEEIDKKDNIIYIHDSVIVKRDFDNVMDIKTIQFLWHFTNHRVHWDKIIEQCAQYNIENNVVTHTDLVKHYLKKYYNTNKQFLNYALHMMDYKNKWVGCMGYMCLINKECLINMNNIINFADIFVKFNTRKERVINESIFSIICHYIFSDINFENSYGGLYYDGYNQNPGAHKPTGFDNLILVGENKYIQKISFAR